MFLTKDEVKDLTGYSQQSKQIAQLKAQRIPFHISHSGHPKVARTVWEGGKAPVAKKATTWSPSWAASAR